MNEDFEIKEIEKFLQVHRVCYDRFTFDKIMRFLLARDFNHEDAKQLILFSCELSALVLQERIYNLYYRKISVNEKMSQDLCELFTEELRSIYWKWNELFKKTRFTID